MKRQILLWILALILLLSACGPSRPVTNDPTATAPPAETNLPSSDPPEGTDPISTESPEDAETTPVDTGEDLRPTETAAPEPTYPSGPFRVYTDDSNYSPYQPPVALYTKPEPGDYSEFHPQAGLGMVFPYAASKLFSSYEGGYSYESGYRYGFADRTGRILTDGIYTSVYPLTWYGYDEGTGDYQILAPIWMTEQVGEVTIHHYSSEYGDYSYPEGEILYGVVAMDGSFALPCEYRNVQLMNGGDRFICYKSWEKPEFTIYNLRGEVLLTGAQILGENADCDGWGIDFGEGLYTVTAYYYGTDAYGRDRPNVCWYADEQGNRVLGPFRSGEAFREGLACASEDGESYGYITKDGLWVIRPRYSWTADFRNGRALQCIGDSKKVVIDKNGRELITCNNGYISRCPCGFSADSSSQTSFYDMDGNLLLSPGSDWSCQTEDVFCKSVYDDQTDRNTITLRSLSSGKEIVVPNVYYFYDSVAVIDGKLVHGLRGNGDYESGRSVFVLYDLSMVYELDSSNPLTIEGFESAYTIYDQFTGERFWRLSSGSAWKVYDDEGRQAAAVNGGSFRLVDGGILEIGTLACTYRDRDGTLLFSYPLSAED